MRYLILVLLLIVLFHPKRAAAQAISEYFDKINKADRLSLTDKRDESRILYKQALKICPEDPFAWFSAAEVSLKLGRTNEVNAMIRGAIVNGANLEMLAHRKDLNAHYNNNKQLKNQYRKDRDRYYANIKYKDEMLMLSAMLAADQFSRSLLGKFDGRKVDSIIRSTDTANMTTLKKIVKEIGFPDRTKVGKEGADAVFILLMHILNDGVDEEENMTMMEPMLRKAVLEGHFYPFNYAILIDRYRGIKSVPQKYGCYWEWDKKGNKIITEIEDLENVDVRRKEIGLNPLGYAAKHQNLVLPAGYMLE